MSRTAVLIGYGGMGKRYHQALKLMKIKTIAICEKKIKKISKENFAKNVTITNDYKKLLKFKADLLCIASNTESRLKILNSFCKEGKIKKIITEKPLSTSYTNCLHINKIVKIIRNKRNNRNQNDLFSNDTNNNIVELNI